MKARLSTVRGFTLIELLVVIAIIGMLASVVLASLNIARIKSRDASRLVFIKQMATALELYYDSTGHYPFDTNQWYASCWQTPSTANWIPHAGNYNWSTGYIPQQPHDPIDTCLWPWDPANTSSAATYAYWSDNGQRYALVVRLEDSTNRNTIQNANTLWFDGNSLYSVHGWYRRASVRIVQ